MRRAEREQAAPSTSLSSRQKCSWCGQCRPGGLAACSEYLPQRDQSLAFSDFLKLNIEICLAIQCC